MLADAEPGDLVIFDHVGVGQDGTFGASAEEDADAEQVGLLRSVVSAGLVAVIKNDPHLSTCGRPGRASFA